LLTYEIHDRLAVPDEFDTLAEYCLDVMLRDVHKIAQRQVFLNDLIDTQCFHLIKVFRDNGLNKIGRQYIHGRYLLEYAGLHKRTWLPAGVRVENVLLLGGKKG